MKELDPNKLKQINNSALLALCILLILGGGLVWEVFTSSSKIFSYEEQLVLGECGVTNNFVYETGNSPEGELLFQVKCQRCHLVDRKMTGPALMGVRNRWADSTDLYSWIKNSQKFLETGDKYAIDLYKAYGTIMPPFPELSDEQIAELLIYVSP